MLQYNKFLEGKKVAFIGPATTLMGSNSGRSLDIDFDVLVRTNGSIFLLDNESYQKDYGSRCDILYTNVQFHRETVPFPIQAWKDKHGLQYLNMKTGARMTINRYDKIIPTRSVSHIIQQLQPLIPGLLMGPVVIADLLHQGVKSLYVTGFDFYYTKPIMFIPGDYREYYPNYLGDKIERKANIANIGKKDMHDQYCNTKYIYDLWYKDLIKVDATMEKIMPEIMQHPEKYTNEGKYGNTGN